MFKTAHNTLTIALIALLVIIILLQHGCSKLRQEPRETECEIQYIRDTTIVVHHDTVWSRQIVRLPSPVPEPVIIYRDIAGAPQKDTLNSYTNTVEDSTIAITYTAEVAGQLNNIDLYYKLLKPTTITEYIDREIATTKTITKVKKASGLYAGAAYTLRDNHVSAGLSLVLPRWQYNYAYNLSTNTHTVGLKRKLFGNKK